jgi:peptidoglycan/LPS O-acetylase OafA/YrhL
MILQSELLDPRRNNFTIVRFVLASSVIYTHSYWLVRGVEGQDDLSPILGAPVSAYAVDGFFFLSGFLVYPSLLRLGKVSMFLLARLARLWPALAVSVSMTALFGLLITTASPATYLGGETMRFLMGNLSLLFGAYFLTGVDCGAAPCNVNGSLWTLTWEARCYVILALLGLTGLARPQIMIRVILPATFVGALLWHLPSVHDLAVRLLGSGIVFQLDLIDRLWTVFALGIAAYILRDRIRLSWLILALLFAATVAAHYVGIGLHARAIFIGYAVLCFGFLTAKNGAVSGAWHDYSYGMYIYAFPLMMVIYALWPTDSYLLLALLNLLATLPVAILSWHFVEKPVLDAFRKSRSRFVPSPLAQP